MEKYVGESPDTGLRPGGDDMGARVQAHDWTHTPLGSIDTWPPELKTAVAFVLDNRLPAALIWGEELTTIYNDAFHSIIGDKPEVLGRSFQDVWKEAWPEVGPIADRALAGHSTFLQNQPIRINRSGEPEIAYFTFSCTPVRSVDGVIQGFIALVIETTQGARAQERARSLASIVESSDDAIISKDLNGIITSWNAGAERVFGYTAEEAVGEPVTILIPSDRQSEEPDILARIRRGERIDHYQTIRQRKNGSLINISLTVSPMKGPNNSIVGASKIARDITDQVRAEKQVAILAHEAEHRTKNVLSTVLATVTLSSAETSAELKQVIAGRIRALADVHSLFSKSQWAGAAIRALVAQELAPYCREGDGRTSLVGPDVMIPPSTAQTLAVALHELATNAAKYGALSTPEGSVRVNWASIPGHSLSLRWVEAGGPAVKPPSREGFGTKVMRSVISSQEGTIDFAWNPEGLVGEIVLPL